MVTYSNLSKYGFDVLDGDGMHALPIQPTDQKVLLPSDPIVFINGTQLIPMYWDVLLSFSVVPKDKFEQFAAMWKPDGQRIRFNMRSVVLPLHPATGELGSGWFETDAIWRLPPIATPGQIRGHIVYDFTITLHRVELDYLNHAV
jgi:hypothetical protein